MPHGAARGNSVLQRDADAVEEAGGADEAVAAATTFGRNAEVGDAFAACAMRRRSPLRPGSAWQRIDESFAGTAVTDWRDSLIPIQEPFACGCVRARFAMRIAAPTTDHARQRRG